MEAAARMLLKSGQRILSEKSWKSFPLSGRFVILLEVAEASDPPQMDLTAGQRPEQQPQRRGEYPYRANPLEYSHFQVEKMRKTRNRST